eukprot:COSAG06_NODE_2378_length_6982_cov_36.074531_8_plen_228_part_00
MHANEVKLQLADGSQSDWVKVETLSEATQAEVTEYNAAPWVLEQARKATLRAQFRRGTHAKTADGAVGVVMDEAPAEGPDANTVHLQLAADGSQTGRLALGTLTVATEAEYEAAEYNAAPWVLEQARKATLRAQFRRGTHAKTADGAVGVVMDEAPAEGPDANTVHLQLAADGSQTGRLSLDTLTVATEAEYEAEVARCGTEHEAEVARAKLAVDDHNLRHWGRTIG